jgi:hypothetical protein
MVLFADAPHHHAELDRLATTATPQVATPSRSPATPVGRRSCLERPREHADHPGSFEGLMHRRDDRHASVEERSM